MTTIQEAMNQLNQNMRIREQASIVPFHEFLEFLIEKPERIIRNVFQIFHDMIKEYVGEGRDEYPDDPESIGFVCYDCNRLLVEGTDYPFFADRLFANRLVGLVEAMERSAQQNKIYIFTGPPGCGKSTFLNNLLMKFEEYANSDNGIRYETVWRLERDILGKGGDGDEVVEIPCPSHDNPILLIPKSFRREFFDDLFKTDEFKWRLFKDKEYDWVFRDMPCTICSSIYQALVDRLINPQDVFSMLYARPYRMNRRLGEGISVFNPGDKPLKETSLTNEILQNRMNSILKDSSRVNYCYSHYAKTNNGVYSLMDIKSHNTDRLIELHNIISEGIHKVEDLEENVDSLLLAVMNPEDQANIQDFRSFTDRIEYIKIPYVLDLKTEVEIYRNIFGNQIHDQFLPRVLNNFARVIIASRLMIRSETLIEWIGDADKYGLYCDRNLQLLKMEIYTGHIPEWLTEEDRKRLTAKRRRRIIAESEQEGVNGISGRDAIKLFNEFYSSYGKDDKLINMDNLYYFFTVTHKDLRQSIPEGLLDSLRRMYNFMLLQEVKESLYYYNEFQISRDIQNYLFAINFEIGAVEICRYTKDRLEITEAYLKTIETRLLGAGAKEDARLMFREDTQKAYTSETLTQEILVKGTPITKTKIYQSLLDRYLYNLKENALDPFLENDNFRRAIKDYGTEAFKTYDEKIRYDVEYLIDNLWKNHHYPEQGAKEVCIYLIDNDIANQFTYTQ